MKRLFSQHTLHSLSFFAGAPLAAPQAHLTAGRELSSVASAALASLRSLSLLAALLIAGIIAVIVLIFILRTLLNRSSAAQYDNAQADHARPDDVAGDVGASVLDTITEAAKSVLRPRRAREGSPANSRHPPGVITGAPAPKAPPYPRPTPQSPWAGSAPPTIEQKEEAASGQPASPAPQASAVPQLNDPVSGGLPTAAPQKQAGSEPLPPPQPPASADAATERSTSLPPAAQAPAAAGPAAVSPDKPRADQPAMPAPAQTATDEWEPAAKVTAGEVTGKTAEVDDPFDWWLDDAEAEEEVARSAPPPIPPIAPPAPATVPADPLASDQQQDEALRAITWQAPDAPGAAPASAADGAPEAGEQEKKDTPLDTLDEVGADEAAEIPKAIPVNPAMPKNEPKPAEAQRPELTSLPDLSMIDSLMKSSAEMDNDTVPDGAVSDASGEPREKEHASSEESLAEAQPQPEPVQFTALYPKEVAVETWNTLLVYTHLVAALPALRADALKFKDELGAGPRESRAKAGLTVARGTELTLVPTSAGVTFNPERISFLWVEDLHRAEFRFQAAKEQAGSAGNGEVAVYAGPLLVATLKIAMLFDEPDVPPPAIPDVEVTADLYKRIFVSYSRKDTPVVVACRNAYKALGITVNMDIDSLRAGEVFDEALMHLIDGSDVFQLFWSERSADSEYVRQEWEYALQRNKGPGFIRPVYWQQPLVPPPAELARLHFAFVELPELETPDGDTA